MFKQTKRKLIGSILIPTLSLFILVLLSVSIALTTYNTSRFVNSINNEINVLVSNLNFNVNSMHVSNENILQNDEVIEYLENGKNENQVKNLLSNKSIQNYYAIGMSIYPAKQDITPVCSSQIGGLVDGEDIYSLHQIENFINSDKDSLLFIRNTAIHYNYDFIHYDSSLGLLSLVDKIEMDGELKGLLFTDLSTDKVYNDILVFSTFKHFSNSNIYLENFDVILKENQNIKEINKESLTNQIEGNLFNSYKALIPVIDDMNLVIEIPSINLQLNNILLFTFATLATSILAIIDILIFKNFIKSSLGALEKLNERMSKDG